MLTIRALLLALFGVVALMAAPVAMAQNPLERLVSPGPLSRAHEKLEATCNVCHESFNKAGQPAKCLDCHKETAFDVTNKRGFHGRSPLVAGKECKTCHVEHEGRNAILVILDEKTFDHRFTDMPLLGAHARVTCAECHQKGVKHAKTPTDCASCHKADEPHKGQLGTACATCHVVSSWKTVSFDHGKTGFALKGKHASTQCAACHVNEKWKDLAATCVSCHAKDDAHEGRFGTDCASCHKETGWKVESFDHARTGFALIGQHAEARCVSCHSKGLDAPLPTTCNGCHAKDDSHKGRNGTACADCHTPRSWTNVSFDHSKTDFALKGKHASVKCESCHTKPVKEWVPPTACSGCHEKDDTHKGLLGPKCADCHAETGWANVRFQHERDAGFALKGKHSSATCASCHKEPTHVKAPPSSCIGCHRDDDPHKRQLGDGCGQCHGETDWQTNVRFDHDLTDFPLLGKHDELTCVQCHITPAFLDAEPVCGSCHQKQDVHKGRFGATCSTCHNPVEWTRVAFNHDTQTAYPLTGKHKQVNCESCHRTPVKGEIDISTRCITCHAADDTHRGSFGTSCERCHTTEDFSKTRGVAN